MKKNCRLVFLAKHQWGGRTPWRRAVDLKAFAFEKDATKRKDIKRAAPSHKKKKKRSKRPLWQQLGDDEVQLIFAHLTSTKCAQLQRLDRKPRTGWPSGRCASTSGSEPRNGRPSAPSWSAASPVFLTGPPGTGKSHLLRTIANSLDERYVVLTASTGAAAEKIGAQTLHSAFCLGHDGPIDVARSIRLCKGLGRCRLYHVRTVVIDEVSMLTSEALDAVLTIVDAVCARDRVQFVLCGDPMQLGEIDTLVSRRGVAPAVLERGAAHARGEAVRARRELSAGRRVGVCEHPQPRARRQGLERDVRWLLKNSHPPTPAEPTFL